MQVLETNWGKLKNKSTSLDDLNPLRACILALEDLRFGQSSLTPPQTVSLETIEDDINKRYTQVLKLESDLHIPNSVSSHVAQMMEGDNRPLNNNINSFESSLCIEDLLSETYPHVLSNSALDYTAIERDPVFIKAVEGIFGPEKTTLKKSAVLASDSQTNISLNSVATQTDSIAGIENKRQVSSMAIRKPLEPLISTKASNDQMSSNIRSPVKGKHIHQDSNWTKKRTVDILDESEDEEDIVKPQDHFMTASHALRIEEEKKGMRSSIPNNTKRLGAMAKRTKFISPIVKEEDDVSVKPKSSAERFRNSNGEIDERLKSIDPKMIEMVMNEIVDTGPQIGWDDIAGLDHAKNTIKEIVVWPMLRPDIFTGLRGPPKGLLLFGPPGTGKTLIGKCIASQANATFFSISSSSLTSKWIGEGEKMVRALFTVARVQQPSVIFVDEIDSLLTQRKDDENEATRRIKTEFLVQFDGCGTNSNDRILMVGATNRPHEIDEAARRRFRKKLYIPLPEDKARRSIVKTLLKRQKNDLTEQQIDEIVKRTEGYSGSDMDGMIREAALGPIRDIKDITKIEADDVRPVNFSDFLDALTQVRASVSDRDLELYLKFDDEYGSKNRA